MTFKPESCSESLQYGCFTFAQGYWHSENL